MATLRIPTAKVAARYSVHPDRRGEDVEQVAGPDVLEEGDRDPLLGAEQGVPQDDAADQEGDVSGKAAAALLLEVGGDEAPHQQLDDGPEEQLEGTHRVARVEQHVAGDEGADDTGIQAEGGET